MERKKKVKKYKEKIIEITSSSQIISGIHNYCDRWCERCTHTKYCAVFLMEQEDNNKDAKDFSNKQFWNKLSLIFEAIFEMIEEDAEKLGLDLNSVKQESYKNEFNKTETEKAATEYGMKITDWLKENNDLFIRKAKVISLINEEELVSLRDAIEVIQWYSLFISAKIHRANFSKFIDDDDDFERDDRNGSAKIALIAIDRSIKALTFLYKHINEKEDDILDFLARLSKIKKQILVKFPKAMEFKRLGFDN